MDPPSELEECWGPLVPVRKKHSLRYACLKKGFSSRGVPPGLSKREAYCSKCKADHCIHHTEMTPKEVMRRLPTEYPKRAACWARYGEKGHVYRGLR